MFSMLSENARGDADNQQESKGLKKISNDYLAGFVDGEGCFYIGFGKRKDLPLGWQVIVEFHLSQNPKGKGILEAFKKRLGCGYIKENHPGSHRDKSLVLIVKKRRDLVERLIPFFKEHSLYSGKSQDFEIFRRVLLLMEEKKHLTKEGFEEIVDLVFNNLDLGKRWYSKKEILSTR